MAIQASDFTADARREKIEQIRQTLRGASEEQIAAVLAALGLS
jgi:hypothetical protein